MARLHGLGALLVLVLLQLLASPASASIPKIKGEWSFGAQIGTCSSQSFAGDTPSAVWSSYVGYANGCNSPWNYSNKGCAAYDDATAISVVCTLGRTSKSTGANGGDATGAVTRSLTCPPFSAPDGSGGCTCSSGYAENGSQTGCVPTNSDDGYCARGAGSFAGDRVLKVPTGTGVVGTTVTGCIGGLGPLPDGSFASCAASGVATMAAQSDGQWYAWLTATYTGGTCDGTEADTKPPNKEPSECADPATCAPPKGKCAGTVNGVKLWVPCSETVSERETKQQKPGTNTDGTPGDRTETTKEETACTATSCTTTKTTQECKPDGTDCKGGTTVVSSGSKAGFCRANPDDPQCEDEGQFGGSCSAGFTCEGDAALCAIAKAAQELHCGDEEAELYDQVKGQYSEAGSLQEALGGGATAISSSSFDQTDATGAAPSGMQDRVISVWGHPYTVKFSVVNPWLEMLGTLAVACSLLLAARIVTRG